MLHLLKEYLMICRWWKSWQSIQSCSCSTAREWCVQFWRVGIFIILCCLCLIYFFYLFSLCIASTSHLRKFKGYRQRVVDSTVIRIQFRYFCLKPSRLMIYIWLPSCLHMFAILYWIHQFAARIYILHLHVQETFWSMNSLDNFGKLRYLQCVRVCVLLWNLVLAVTLWQLAAYRVTTILGVPL